MMSIKTRGIVHFLDYIIWIVNHVIMKLGQLLDTAVEKYF